MKEAGLVMALSVRLWCGPCVCPVAGMMHETGRIEPTSGLKEETDKI